MIVFIIEQAKREGYLTSPHIYSKSVKPSIKA